MCGESGWVPVDRGTLETKSPGVFAIGDVTGIMLTSIGKPLPKAGVFAHREAEVVAHNIARAITGIGDEKRFAGDGACFIETGDSRAAFGSGNFYADPAPQIRLKHPGVLLRLGKVAYEKLWLHRSSRPYRQPAQQAFCPARGPGRPFNLIRVTQGSRTHPGRCVMVTLAPTAQSLFARGQLAVNARAVVPPQARESASCHQHDR